MLRITLTIWLFLTSLSLAAQHMNLPPVHWVSQRDSSLPMIVENYCDETIYAAFLTQAGTGPSTTGFRLPSGASKRLTVSENWQGRVWGRTNCSFNSDGTGPNPVGGPQGNGAACSTGDCGGVVQCSLAGWPPATLAEFNLQSSSGQAFYDISLVDGYNLPMGIFNLFNESSNAKLRNIPPNLTNPICLGSPGVITSPNNAPDRYFGTNKTYPIPLEQKSSVDDVSKWCPWDLQVNSPDKPNDGVYTYPDDDISRPAFDPCYSACAKSGKPSDCCTGKYNSPDTCNPSSYSKAAKAVCPDAYSYAFDDQTSTFIVPQGGGFGVAFCPRGRSSNILATMGDQLRGIASQRTFVPMDRLTIRDTTDNVDRVCTSDGTSLGSQASETATVALVVAITGMLILV